MIKHLVFQLGLALSAGAACASAVCSSYEEKVFELVDRASYFQESDLFRESGWSKAGPTNGWLSEYKELKGEADPQDEQSFYQTYGFDLANVYQVADQYRTEGFLDDYYQSILNEIRIAKRCRAGS